MLSAADSAESLGTNSEHLSARVDPSQGFLACSKALISRVPPSAGAVGNGVLETSLLGRELACLTPPWSRAEGKARRTDVELAFTTGREVTPVCLAASALLDCPFCAVWVLSVDPPVEGRESLEECLEARLSMDYVCG